MATAALDGDGKNDLVVAASANRDARQLYAFLTTGDGTFQTPVACAATTKAIVPALGEVEASGLAGLTATSTSTS